MVYHFELPFCKFLPWTRMFVFYRALIRLRKVCIQVFSLQLLINSRVDSALYLSMTNNIRRENSEFKPFKLEVKKNWPFVSSCSCGGVGKYILKWNNSNGARLVTKPYRLLDSVNTVKQLFWSNLKGDTTLVEACIVRKQVQENWFIYCF